jgi:hypothetical protein
MSDTINWKDLRKQADDATKPVPADWYEVIVDKAEAKQAQTGSQMIAAQFKIETGPHAGRTVFTNFVFTPDKAFALNIFFRNMEALGVDGSFFAQLQEAGFGVEAAMAKIAETIAGRRARIEVGMRTWNGQERNEVKNMAAPTTGPGGTPGGGQAPAVLSGGPAGGPPVPPASAGLPPVPPAAPSSADVTAPPALPY